jgi:hypothetical protein
LQCDVQHKHENFNVASSTPQIVSTNHQNQSRSHHLMVLGSHFDCHQERLVNLMEHSANLEALSVVEVLV